MLLGGKVRVRAVLGCAVTSNAFIYFLHAMLRGDSRDAPKLSLKATVTNLSFGLAPMALLALTLAIVALGGFALFLFATGSILVATGTAANLFWRVHAIDITLLIYPLFLVYSMYAFMV